MMDYVQQIKNLEKKTDKSIEVNESWLVKIYESLKDVLPVRPLPFIGKNYESGGILVMGESHYTGKKENGENHDVSSYSESDVLQATNKVVLDFNYQLNKHNHRFIENIYTALNGENCTRPLTKVDFFNKISFYNFRDPIMASARNDENTDYLQSSRRSFVRIVDVLKPSIVIVFSIKSYRELPCCEKPCCERPCYKRPCCEHPCCELEQRFVYLRDNDWEEYGRFKVEYCTYKHDGRIMTVFGLPHLTGSYGSKDYLNNREGIIKKMFDALNVLSEQK